METKANYALIGAFVLLAFAAAVAFVAWLSNSEFDQQFEEYLVQFNGPVRGLSQGGEVRYNGLRVGEVTRLSLDPNDSNTVIATVEVDANTPVRTDSSARLEPQGLTGLSYIQIFAGNEEFPLLTEFGEGPYVIPGEGSTLDSILQDGTTVLDSATRALSGVNNTLSDEAIADFQGILANVNAITGRLAESDLDADSVNNMVDQFTETARDVSEMTRAIEATAEEAQTLVPTIREDLDQLVARVNTTMDNVDSVLVSANGAVGEGELLMVDAREAVNRLSNSGLTDLEETTDSLRQLVATLNRIAVQLETSPTQFIVGERRAVVEIPQ